MIKILSVYAEIKNISEFQFQIKRIDISTLLPSTVKFSDYIGKGKYMLVDFWASWCGPCIREIPNIINVYDKYAGDKFDILSVAVWDELSETKRMANNLGIKWNQIVNAGSIPTDLYGIDGIPHIILFGPDGTILKRSLRGDDIEAEIAKYVSAN